MDNTGMGAVLASMTHGDNRYEGALMLSALPNAPVISDPPRLAERVRLWRRRRTARPVLTSAPARRSPEASQPCGALEGQPLVSCG